MPLARIFVAALMLAHGFATLALAQQARTESVRFAAGSSGTVISDSISGYEVIDYKLNAGSGQRMVVDLATSNLSNYFNVISPDGDVALFVGAQKGTHFEGILPVSGNYTIRIFLMRNAARRDETANYNLSIYIGGAITKPADEVIEDGAGSPDFWEVTAGALNIRSAGSTTAAIVGRAEQGEIFRNNGCQGAGDARWCHIETPNGLMSGWVSGLYLEEFAGPPPLAQAETETDAMGPDFWMVEGVPAGDHLNIRTGPGTSNAVVARARNETILRNLGCHGRGDIRWCHIRMPDGSFDGWVFGAYLIESGEPPATPNRPRLTIYGNDSLSPTLHVRPTGEIEASWSSGCVVLFDSVRQPINAGSSCSVSQLQRSQQLVERM